MITRIRIIREFVTRLKAIEKKYPGAQDIVNELINQLTDGERPGDKIAGVGYDVYKVRLRNSAAGRDKSGGFRAIYYVELPEQVMLVTIYIKTEQTDILTSTIKRIIDEALSEEQ